jgi:hypothetical protein
MSGVHRYLGNVPSGTSVQRELSNRDGRAAAFRRGYATGHR